MIAILDRGHGLKADGFDPGVVRGDLREVDLATAYLDVAADILARAGVRVVRLDSGAYTERHKKALAAAGSTPALYVQGHVNAGGGSYGLVRPDARSKRGAAAAVQVAKSLAEMTGQRTRTDPLYANSQAAEAGGRSADKEGSWSWWTRGHGCIAGVYAGPATICGVLYEPFFIDDPREDWHTRHDLIGSALAAGMLAFLRGA